MLEITLQPERQVLTIGVQAVNALTSGAKAVRILSSLCDAESFAKFAEASKTAGAVAIHADSDNVSKLAQNVKYRAKQRKVKLAVAPLTAFVDGENVTIGHSFRVTK